MRILLPRSLFLFALGCTATVRPVVPPGVSTIGTAHPTFLIEAAPDGSWVAICQARVDTNHDGKIEVGSHGGVRGDRSAPYLVLGSGPGTPIDRFLGYDPSGRWIAYAREHRRWLLDTKTGAEVALDPRAPEPDAGARNPFAPTPMPGPRFDALGVNLLYLTGDVTNPRVVLRRLSDGQESESRFPARPPLAGGLLPGRHVCAHAVPRRRWGSPSPGDLFR